MKKILIVLLALPAVLFPPVAAAQTSSPEAPREFRGAWITTLRNLDWPSEPGLSAQQQQRELIAMLDNAVRLNLNAVVLQVRSMGEAFYDSEHAPWSHFLSGEMGRPPSPYYDPLEFAVREAHKRGLELHAWFNPYRLHFDLRHGGIAGNHMSRTRPDLVRRYSNLLWLDPSDDATRRHVLEVVLEVVRNYDVDGVHFDDYFYPWPEGGLDFPDDANWERYRRRGGNLSRDDWRRANVNELIRRFYTEVKREAPEVKVGISPFGIWRPEHPEGIRGMDQYATLYADPKRWLNEGWLDYLAPQLYWRIDQAQQSFPRLLAWWASENHRNRHIWPGLATWKVTDDNWPTGEIITQIRQIRRQRGATGHIHFRYAWLRENRSGIADLLRQHAYTGPALVPPSPWLGDTPPSRPRLEIRVEEESGDRILRYESPDGENVRLWAVYARNREGWRLLRTLPAYERRAGTLRIPASDRQTTHVAISAVDRLGNESDKAAVRIR